MVTVLTRISTAPNNLSTCSGKVNKRRPRRSAAPETRNTFLRITLPCLLKRLLVAPYTKGVDSATQIDQEPVCKVMQAGSQQNVKQTIAVAKVSATLPFSTFALK